MEVLVMAQPFRGTSGDLHFRDDTGQEMYL